MSDITTISASGRERVMRSARAAPRRPGPCNLRRQREPVGQYGVPRNHQDYSSAGSTALLSVEVGKDTVLTVAVNSIR